MRLFLLKLFVLWFSCNFIELVLHNAPEIIGEGDVTSMVNPDGSIQYFFMPISQWWPHMYTPINNMSPAWSPTVWLVRNINNPQPSPFFCQLRQRPSGVFQKQLFDLDISKSDPTFKLKFHNDGWTSTTDLVYFYPSLRSSNWLTNAQCKGNAAIQVELPSWTICHCETVRKTHDCLKSEDTKRSTFDLEHSADEAVASMSIDDISSKQNINKNLKCWCDKMRCKRKKNVTCQCNNIPKLTTNKLISTFADQASNCFDISERPTQTLKCTGSSMLNITSKDDIKPELWVPKTSFAKKGLKSKLAVKSVDLSSCTSDCSCHEPKSQ